MKDARAVLSAIKAGDKRDAAKILEAALENPATRKAVLRGLAAFIYAALQGFTLDPD